MKLYQTEYNGQTIWSISIKQVSGKVDLVCRADFESEDEILDPLRYYQDRHQ